MSKLARIVVVLLACAVCAPAQANRAAGAAALPPVPDYDFDAWGEFKSAAGRFAVLLPGVPREQVSRLDMPGGGIDSHAYVLRNSNRSPQYDVSYFDLPAGSVVEDAEAALDGMRDEGLAAVGGRLLDEREAGVGGHPGRSYKVAARGGEVMRIRTLLVGGRVYTLQLTTPGPRPPAAEARLHEEMAAKFHNSFRLLSDEELSAFGGEVERLLKSLRARGETVLTPAAPCEPPGCAPPPAAEVGEARVRSGAVVSKPPPDYPAVAKAARAAGTVVVRVVVDEAGRVLAAQAVSGHPMLRAAAVRAARAAVFAPTLLDGKPFKIVGTLSYDFNLQ